MLKPGIYRLNPRRLSLSKLRAFAPGKRGLLFFLARILRLWWPRAFLRHPAAMSPIAWSEIPPGVSALLTPSAAALREGGFENVFWYEYRGIGVHLYGGAFLSADWRTVASAQAALGPAGVQSAVLKVTSVTRSQSRIVTTSERPLLESPPEYEVTYRPGQAAGELLAEHRERVVSLDIEDNLPAELPERLKKAAERTLSFHVERGVYVWVAAGEEQLSRSILRP